VYIRTYIHLSSNVLSLVTWHRRCTSVLIFQNFCQGLEQCARHCAHWRSRAHCRGTDPALVARPGYPSWHHGGSFCFNKKRNINVFNSISIYYHYFQDFLNVLLISLRLCGTTQAFGNMRGRNSADIWRKVKVLVVDEISMVDAEFLDWYLSQVPHMAATPPPLLPSPPPIHSGTSRGATSHVRRLHAHTHTHTHTHRYHPGCS
jgi:hypothetical protein